MLTPSAAARRLALMLALFLLAALPSSARAQTADPLAKPTHPQAREHLARGNKLYAVREFDAAIAEYKAGALLEDAPVFQYNLAQSYRLSNKPAEALWHYERFLNRANPPDPLRSAVVRFIEELRPKAAAQQAPAAPAPTPEKPTPPPTRPTRWSDDNAGWAITASGAGLLITSTTLLLLARSIDSDADGEPLESRRADLRERASTRRTIGYILGGLGLVGVSLGTAKLAIHTDASTHAAATVAWAF